MHKKKRYQNSGSGQPEAPELNIMPFIDIFSMLNTFLLVSAAFLGLGILEVQIPFLSNSPDVKDEPARTFTVRVDVEDTQVKVLSLWTTPPDEKKEETFKFDSAELDRYHKYMIDLRMKVPENDKATVYAENTVTYDNLVKVIDGLKTLKEKEPSLNLPSTDPKEAKDGKRVESRFIFEKVVIGSVIL